MFGSDSGSHVRVGMRKLQYDTVSNSLQSCLVCAKKKIESLCSNRQRSGVLLAWSTRSRAPARLQWCRPGDTVRHTPNRQWHYTIVRRLLPCSFSVLVLIVHVRRSSEGARALQGTFPHQDAPGPSCTSSGNVEKDGVGGCLMASHGSC